MNSPKPNEKLKNVFYINLEKRKDRKEKIENQLNSLGWEYERFDAISHENGAIGCSLSHLQVLLRAKRDDLDYVVVNWCAVVVVVETRRHWIFRWLLPNTLISATGMVSLLNPPTLPLKGHAGYHPLNSICTVSNTSWSSPLVKISAL